MMQIIGDRIKKNRLELGLTLNQLAKASGISKSMLSAVENKKSNISLEKLIKLSTACNVSLDHFIRNEDPLITIKEKSFFGKFNKLSNENQNKIMKILDILIGEQ